MYIFIDESYDETFFVLGATIVDNPDILVSILKKFRSEVRKSSLRPKDKEKINNDPKENILYRSYPKFLSKYIDLICNDFTLKSNSPRLNIQIAGGYLNTYASLNGSTLATAYEKSFMAIYDVVASEFPDQKLHFILDTFDQVNEIIVNLNQLLSRQNHTAFSITHAHGYERPELIVSDIIAGTSRRHLQKEKSDFYYEFKHLWIKELVEVSLY